jgi:low affinity Fe/Cu permease
MADDKENKGLKEEEIKEATRVEESIAAYDLSPTMEENLIPREKVGAKLKGIPNSPQLAATSEEDGNMPQHYFDKYIDQRMASIDEKIVGLRCELQSRTDSIQRTVDHSLAEIRERDNQRHAEIMAMETKANERLEQSLAEMRERDNQRHAEILAMEARSDAKLEQLLAELHARDNQRHAEIIAMETKLDERITSLDNKIDGLNKWITAFVIGSLLSIAALTLQALLK